MFIEWKKVYNLDHELIDYQHKKLVELINELHEAHQNGMVVPILEDILDRLVDYTAYHFSTEERLFQDLQYPEAKEHISEHEEFVAEIFYLKYQAKDGNLLITLKILDYLKDWTITHILGTDQEFGQLFKRNSSAEKVSHEAENSN